MWKVSGAFHVCQKHFVLPFGQLGFAITRGKTLQSRHPKGKSCRVRPPCSAGNVTQWHQRGCCCAREPQPSPPLKPQMRPHTSLTLQMRQQPELELEPEPDVAVRPVCNVCNSVLVHPKME